MGENRRGILIGMFLGFIISTFLVYLILNYLGKVSGYMVVFKVLLLIFIIGLLIKSWFGKKVLT